MTDQHALAFAIETGDEHWIKRNSARIDDAGRAVIMLPASELELVTLGQKPFVYLRNGLAKGNYPRELQWQSSLICPADWVPETVAYLAAQKTED